MNVIIIVNDTLRWDFLGCYGNDWIKTPNFDRFASDACLFTRAYSEGLPTIAARTAMFTGRFTFPLRGWQRLECTDVHLAEILQHENYTSALISDTYHMLKPSMNFGRGFDHVEWIRGQEFDPFVTDSSINVHDKLESVYKAHPKYPQFKQYLEQYFRNISAWDWSNEENHFVAQVVKHAIEWLESQRKNDRLFLWIDCFDPHEPWDPPKPYRSMYDPDYQGMDIVYPAYTSVEGYLTPEELSHVRALYAAEVTMVDKWVGMLLEKIKQLGFYDNSMIVWTSDHGVPLGEHGIIMKARPWPYEEVIHVPLAIRVPDGVGRGRKIEAIVETPDLAPTIIDFLDISKPSCMHGHSILPLVSGASKRIRDYAYCGYYAQSWTIVGYEWKYIKWLKGESTEYVSCDIVFPGTDKSGKTNLPELFNLQEDPLEKINLAELKPDLLTRLDLKLKEFISVLE